MPLRPEARCEWEWRERPKHAVYTRQDAGGDNPARQKGTAGVARRALFGRPKDDRPGALGHRSGFDDGAISD